MLFPTLLLLLPYLISANMWDNLHYGHGVPFQLPWNFSMLFSPTGFSNLIKYSIHTDTDHNGLSINTTSPAIANETAISQLKFNFTTGTMIAYSHQKGCVIVKNSSLVYNDFYSSLEGILELALLLNSYDKENIYKKVDVTQLLKLINVTGCVSNLALYFLNDRNLHLIESSFKSGNKSSFTVDKITHKNTGIGEFKAHPDWQCKKMKVIQVKGIDYVVPDRDDSIEDKSYQVIDDVDDDEGYEEEEQQQQHSDKNVNEQSESLVDLILDYIIPLNLSKSDRDAIHYYMAEFFINYIGCDK